ncbi:MAG: hypothetical protein MJZ05_11780 [Fibrobacter sp.]|nr:hypothetical protein [Fibrobacter sp.]
MMKVFLFVCICITDVIAQTYVYNAYERSYVDDRDGTTYNTVDTDSSKWFVEDLRYIPESTFGAYMLNGELYCESTFKSKQTAVDVFSKKLNEKCRKVYYKWDLAMKSCPQGWHLAKTQEWMELSVFLKKNPFLHKVFFQDKPNYFVTYNYGKGEYVIYDHMSMWWNADLDKNWKKNTRANVTHFQKNEIVIKENTQFGGRFWTRNSTKSWTLLPVRCVENKMGIDYSTAIPKIDTSSSIKYGHGLKTKTNEEPKLRLDQLM